MSNLATPLLALLMSMPVLPPMMSTEAPEPVPYEIAAEKWEAKKGDRVIVDTLNNEGFLFHTDGSYLRFPVVTGQRRWVYYIGRSYNATTPTWDWTAKELDVKGDRVTFGPSGRFLRLFKDGEDRTAYGFHEHRDEDIMFDADALERYRSMGCIIVRTDMMDLLVHTYHQNNQKLDVVTRYGIDDLKQIMMAFEEDEENVETGEEVALY